MATSVSKVISNGGEGCHTVSRYGEKDCNREEASTSVRPVKLTRRFCEERVALGFNIVSVLNDDVLEKIFSKLGFQSLFQVPSLSKAWRNTFSCPSFQRAVELSAASSWHSYAPLFLNDKKEMVGYDSSSKALQRLPAHSFVPQDVRENWILCGGAGALLCWLSLAKLPISSTEISPVHIIISNPLTKRWKQLCPCRKVNSPEGVHFFAEAGSGTYKVILSTRLVSRRQHLHWEGIRLQIYDSSTSAWTVLHYMDLTSRSDHFGGETYQDGVLRKVVYKWYRSNEVTYDILSLDATQKDGGKEYSPYTRQTLFTEPTEFFYMGRLVTKKAPRRLKFSRTHKSGLLVFQDARIWKSTDSMCDVQFAAGQDDCIYIGTAGPESPFISFNVETREWDSVPPPAKVDLSFRSSTTDMYPDCEKWRWASDSYSPGLNTFSKL